MEKSTARLEEHGCGGLLGEEGRPAPPKEDPFVPSACLHMVTLMIASSIVVGFLIPSVILTFTLKRTINEKSPFALQQLMAERNETTILGAPWRMKGNATTPVNLVCVMGSLQWGLQHTAAKLCSHLVITIKHGALVDLLEQMIHPPAMLAPPSLTLSALRQYITKDILNTDIENKPRHILRIEDAMNTLEFVSQTLLRIEYVSSNLVPWLVRNMFDGLYLERLFKQNVDAEATHSMLDFLRGFHRYSRKYDMDVIVELTRKSVTNINVKDTVLPFVTIIAITVKPPTTSERTYLPAPLFSDSNTTESIAAAVDAFLEHDIDTSKLMLSLSLTATTFTLESEDETQLGAVNRPGGELGKPGPFSKTAGRLWYREFCHFLKSPKHVPTFDPLAATPYFVIDDQWIAFENAASLKYKIRFAVNKGLSGVAIQDITSDDYQGVCGKPMALISSVYTTLTGSPGFAKRFSDHAGVAKHSFRNTTGPIVALINDSVSS